MRLHNVQLHGGYDIPDILRMMRWVGHTECNVHKRSVFVIIIEPERKKPLGSPRRTGVYRIRIVFKGM